ncbi:hypothetical protein ABG067_002749 [Albugo candida]
MSDMNSGTRQITVSSADQLKQYFDPPRYNHKHSILSSSKAVWNGQEFDSKPFSRFNPPTNYVPTKDCREAYKKPIVSTEKNLIRPSDNPNAVPVQSKYESITQEPEIVYRVPPRSIALPEGLMTPQDRRERLHFVKDYYQAANDIAKKEMRDRRSQQLVKAAHMTSDVLNVGNHQTTPRINRGEPYRSDFLSHNNAEIKPAKKISSRCDSSVMSSLLAQSADSTQPFETKRATHLRNEVSAGRSYDIINGGKIAYYAPNIAEKTHLRQAHPSIIICPYAK